MYGRCETDPFEFAIEVCNACWGEYCSLCIASADRRRPLCKDCALIKAGVRQGRIAAKGEKKTVKKRRAELKAKAAERGDEYFVSTVPDLKPEPGPEQAVPEPVRETVDRRQPIAPPAFIERRRPDPLDQPVDVVPPAPDETATERRRGIAALAQRLQSNRS